MPHCSNVNTMPKMSDKTAIILKFLDNTPEINSGLHTDQLPAGSSCLLHMTDTHFGAIPKDYFVPVDMDASFVDTLDLFKRMHWKADACLATGDLVHEGVAEMYQVLAGHFDELGIPTYGLPGNHDENDAMQAGFQSNFCSTPKIVDLPHWRLVLIDSTIPRQSGGHISDDQFDLIHTAIEDTENHVLIALHHNPISTKSAWLDRMTIDNGEQLMELARQSDKVKAIVWGHVHQEFDARYEGVRLLATPSTCMQFTPKATRFDVDEVPPGFRLLALLPNGEIATQVVRATFENPNAIAALFENQ